MIHTDVISKPIYQILTDLTREPRLEVALPLAIKDWVRLKLKEVRREREEFEQRYNMDFQSFQRAWHQGQIADSHSYEVERDYWEWEATVTDEERLCQMLERLCRWEVDTKGERMDTPRYTIIETDSGPFISESRTTVYDVMEAYDAGENMYGIARIYNLTPLQVETALQYIAAHRETLEQDLVEIRREKAELEAYYNARAAEIQRKINAQPMTPERAAFYAFREQARKKWAERYGSVNGQMGDMNADRAQ